jgi:hypothetical protein
MDVYKFIKAYLSMNSFYAWAGGNSDEFCECCCRHVYLHVYSTNFVSVAIDTDISMHTA